MTPHVPGDRPDAGSAYPEYGYSDSEFRQRLQADLDANTARRQARRDDRAAFQQRRDAGLRHRHRQRLGRGGHPARDHIDQLSTPPLEGAQAMTQPIELNFRPDRHIITAVEALDEVLRHFTNKGHPGRPCLRTDWINTETVQRWHTALSAARHPARQRDRTWLDHIHLANGLHFDQPISATDAVEATRRYIETLTQGQP